MEKTHAAPGPALCPLCESVSPPPLPRYQRCRLPLHRRPAAPRLLRSSAGGRGHGFPDATRLGETLSLAAGRSRHKPRGHFSTAHATHRLRAQVKPPSLLLARRASRSRSQVSACRRGPRRSRWRRRLHRDKIPWPRRRWAALVAPASDAARPRPDTRSQYSARSGIPSRRVRVLRARRDGGRVPRTRFLRWPARGTTARCGAAAHARRAPSAPPTRPCGRCGP